MPKNQCHLPREKNQCHFQKFRQFDEFFREIKIVALTFSLGKWHWFLAISKFSLGKKVNAKIMISRKKVFCTTKFFPLVYLANHVEIHMWSLQNFCITVFWKNFRENTSLVKRFTLNLISWNISQVIQNFVNSTLSMHCTANCGKMKNISSN